MTIYIYSTRSHKQYILKKCNIDYCDLYSAIFVLITIEFLILHPIINNL